MCYVGGGLSEKRKKKKVENYFVSKQYRNLEQHLGSTGTWKKEETENSHFERQITKNNKSHKDFNMHFSLKRHGNLEKR